jgi:hypothetical protein
MYTKLNNVSNTIFEGKPNMGGVDVIFRDTNNISDKYRHFYMSYLYACYTIH